MTKRQSRPWCISDARNDVRLETVLRRLPRGSGLIFRHYHLPPVERRARFRALARFARRFGHAIVLAGSVAQARRWAADGAYGPPGLLTRGGAVLRMVSVHSLREVAGARRARADAVLLSPVFATASHPGAKVLGGLRFRLIAGRAMVPVIALGGMTRRRARSLGAQGWAAIDGICDKAIHLKLQDS